MKQYDAVCQSKQSPNEGDFDEHRYVIEGGRSVTFLHPKNEPDPVALGAPCIIQIISTN